MTRLPKGAARYFKLYLFGISLTAALNVFYVRHSQRVLRQPFALVIFAALIICITAIENLIAVWIKPPQLRPSKNSPSLRVIYYIPLLLVGMLVLLNGSLMLIGPAFIINNSIIWITGIGEATYVSCLSIVGYLIMRESFIQLCLLVAELSRKSDRKTDFAKKA